MGAALLKAGVVGCPRAKEVLSMLLGLGTDTPFPAIIAVQLASKAPADLQTYAPNGWALLLRSLLTLDRLSLVLLEL